jgi:hypothetical protein
MAPGGRRKMPPRARCPMTEIDAATTPRLAFQPTRRAHLVEIAVQIQLEQIGRSVGRLAGSAVRADGAKAERAHIECVNIRVDRTHRIVRGDVIRDARRQQARLLAALAGLVSATYHDAKRTSAPHADEENSCPASQRNPLLRRAVTD